MKNLILALVSVSFSASVFPADLLTGERKLACEAVLCLSTNNRPAECIPSIRRYFDIYDKTWSISKTIRERKNFLKLCPSADESPGMANLVDTIANGAGRCDADYLNKTLKTRIPVWDCKSYDSNEKSKNRFSVKNIITTRIYSHPGQENLCVYEEKENGGIYDNIPCCDENIITVISNKLPSYCITYENNEYTTNIGARYIGDIYNGGKWVDKN